MVEHLTFNQVVWGSIPQWLTKCKQRLALFVLKKFAGVAELADALDLGSSGRPCRFKSCHPHCYRVFRRLDTSKDPVFCALPSTGIILETIFK